jgi:enediyne polyketide synthase
MNEAIALVGMACRYPDANNPKTLWENVLTKRRAFRRLPPERLNLADYFAENPTVPDAIYCSQAAVIEGYEFDRIKYRISANTYQSTDLTHWLALDVATQALEDAGFPEGKGLIKERTGVLVGNTLTGEFSRAALMRLRWPFVRRMVDAQLRKQGWESEHRKKFLLDLEVNYKKPFEPVGEETLAGGLSNTIAGRICNYFDFRGGGYTLDGACSSSLIAVANACNSLVAGDLDVVVVGGVDLSLDPFELVGFSKTGALARSEMSVYDIDSNGFWPGEGCGFVILMRYEDALAHGARCYALIRGWGISSDGSGGMTRPEQEGQRLAIERAYQRAGYGIETVPLFEGHGTGTRIGDDTELQVLTKSRRAANPKGPVAVVGSIKANLGHTKAAAGIAGLLKAVLAVHHQILPPATGFKHPHPVLQAENANLRLLAKGEVWPSEQPLRAGVSSFGFGGINVHLTLEGLSNTRRTKLMSTEQILLATSQDCELFLLGADEVASLLAVLHQLAEIVPRLALSELSDLASMLARSQGKVEKHSVRAAFIAATSAQLTEQIAYLVTELAAGKTQVFEINSGIFYQAQQSTPKTEPRITFLFAGQASPVRLNGGAWAQRFTKVQSCYERASLPVVADDLNSTAVGQAAIITAELAGLQLLESLGVSGQLALGHSLGEFAALHWAGAMNEATLLDIVKIRGRAMAKVSGPAGAMLSLAVDGDKAKTFCTNQEDLNLACFNGPQQTIISGTVEAIEKLQQEAQAQNIKATRLPVSHGFHSNLMIPATEVLEAHLAQTTLHPLQWRVISTTTGAELNPTSDLRTLFKKQLTHPVQFTDALNLALPETDLLIEIGPGQTLTELVRQMTEVPVIALDVAGSSLQNLLRALGAAYVMGSPLNPEALFSDRHTRPFSLDWYPKFFVNPCELAPQLETSASLETTAISNSYPTETKTNSETKTEKIPVLDLDPDDLNILERLRVQVAKNTNLPTSTIQANNRLLADLHLNSITVGQIVTEVGRQLGLPAPADPTAYADATVVEIAQAMEERIKRGEVEAEPLPTLPVGIDTWIRPFTVVPVERPLRGKSHVPTRFSHWQVFGPSEHPLKMALEQRLNEWGEGGVALCLPETVHEKHVSLMLEAVQAVLNQKIERQYFLMIQLGSSAAALARSLYREHPDLITCVITLPLNDSSLDHILAEVQVSNGYHEIYYDSKGVRYERVLKPLNLDDEVLDTLESKPQEPQNLVLTSDDILLVTGGGKGITAECAAALAQKTSVRLVLLGRASPESDAELAKNLARFQMWGLNFKYFQTDVTNAAAVKATIVQTVREWGPITALLHGAGANKPTLLHKLDETAFQQTLAPKVGGLRHLLAALDPNHLRLLISFGSIIATTGMQGEADYAVANEWVASITAAFQHEHPHCRCLTLEWTIWSEIGMGKRLGSDEILAQQGITPISPDMGIALFRQALQAYDWPSTVVVTGRMPDVPTLPLERPDLPFGRFLEQPRVYYPGIELVIEAELSLPSDPYLNDHIYAGQRLFAAVMGLEAMAQVASAVLGSDTVPRFEKVEFSRPVVVDEIERVQIVALVQSKGKVDVALRCAQTGFKVDHFRARCCFQEEIKPQAKALESKSPSLESKALAWGNHDTEKTIPIDPQQELYGRLLFQTGRFKRLQTYHHIEATQCLGTIAAAEAKPWFGRYLPPTLMLGDPGTRDATIHAIQVCTPHAQLLPIGIDSLKFANVLVSGPWTVLAKERWRKGELFCYDLTVRGQHGELREIWEGLHLRQVSTLTWPDGWPEPLLSSYLERRLQELLPEVSLRVVLHRDTTQREFRSENAIKQLLGSDIEIVRRPDGKPEVPHSDRQVSTAHAGDLTLAVTGAMTVACDLEHVDDEPVWADLLGIHQDLVDVIAQEMGEDNDKAATRIWTARECLKKAGALLDTPLTIKNRETDTWILLSAGEMTIASLVISVKTSNTQLALAVLVKTKT